LKRALITGITGQDGSYLAELLLDKGYEVHGLARRSSALLRSPISTRPEESGDSGIRLHYGDLLDSASLMTALQAAQPNEVYHLAAQSHVGESFANPVYTGEATALGTIRLLEAVRTTCPESRFYQASSSEMFGAAVETPQRETTPFRPQSPYGAAKVYAFLAVRNYREAYGAFAVNGILFNHESPRRGSDFVTRKITLGAARIHCGLQKKLYLGNMDAQRDWGFAGDYVRAMWLMLQQDEPEDFVVATGESRSVRDFARLAFARLGMDYRQYIEPDPRYFRPSEVDHLLGDASKARRQLGWRPRVGFEELVHMMVDADLEWVQGNKKGHTRASAPEPGSGE
jgi:GDPmannose 4,6-dehydratase